MFLREARLATLLNHENVVHAFEFGEIEGELFLAMEYVEGETLARARCSRRERLPLDVAAYVLAEVCEGLHAAHELKDVIGRAARRRASRRVSAERDARVRRAREAPRLRRREDRIATSSRRRAR